MNPKSADSLEEVVGLDIGYSGGVHKSHSKMNEELETKMDEYLKEYEHRQRERVYLKRVNTKNTISSRGAVPASSVHQESLHGNSYHGRKIITSDMIEY